VDRGWQSQCLPAGSLQALLNIEHFLPVSVVGDAAAAATAVDRVPYLYVAINVRII
jgi:hypothetical protein